MLSSIESLGGGDDNGERNGEERGEVERERVGKVERERGKMERGRKVGVHIEGGKERGKGKEKARGKVRKAKNE